MNITRIIKLAEALGYDYPRLTLVASPGDEGDTEWSVALGASSRGGTMRTDIGETLDDAIASLERWLVANLAQRRCTAQAAIEAIDAALAEGPVA